MRYQNNDLLREYLDRGAVGAYREHLRHPGFEVDDAAFAATLADVRTQHPGLKDDEAEARAAFRLLTTGAAPPVIIALPSRWYRARAWCLRHAPLAARIMELLWAAALLLLAIATVILLSALMARSEPLPPQPANIVSANDAARALLLHPPELLPQIAGGSLAARVQFLNGSNAWTNVSSSNALPVTCISGCTGGGSSGGTSAADEAAFTEGSTPFTPAGGYYKTSPAVLTTGQGGTVALTANRAFHVTLYGSSGSEITTLPVSGTFWQATQPVSWSGQSVGLTGTLPAFGATPTFNCGTGCYQTTQPVSGTFWQATQPVSNAGTFAVQAAQSGTWTVTGAGGTFPVTGTFWQGTQPVSGTFWQTTQPVSLASLPALASGTNVIGSVKQTDGTNTLIVDPCAGQSKVYTPISQTAGATLVSGTSAKKQYICHLNIVTATAQNVALVAGTGTVCATSTHTVMGGTTAATGWNFAANGGLAIGDGSSSIGVTSTNADNLCLLQSSTGQISGVLVTAVQ